METAQERELQLQGLVQGWPFHATAAGLDASSGYYSGSCGGGGAGGGDWFMLGWEPPLGCFGVVAAAADAHFHDLFPLCMMESLPVSPAAAVPPEPHDAVALPVEELDDLLLNFWDASSYGDATEQQHQVAINSSCLLPHEKSSSSAAATATATATTNSSFIYDDGDDDPLGSIFSRGPTLPEEEAVFQAPAPALPAEQPLLSSSSSSSHAGPQASDGSGAQTRDATAASGRAPPLPRRCSSSSSSLKRATPEVSETETEAEWSESGGKRPRKEAPASVSTAGRVVCPFAVLKPDGLDGGATLADINARILMRPARPVRHPVGEFACAPRALSADAPGISGKAVSGFTRLHTPGRGTITIIRTRG